MAPRKSTASVASTAATASPNGPGEISIVTTATPAAEPKSPTAQKPNRQSAAGDADIEKSEKKKAKNDDLNIDDLLLPRTLTSRLSRGTLPANTSIQRDALLALTKSATVFISYLAHNANNLTARKTIQSQDILEALRETELWNVALPGGGVLGERVRAEAEKWEGEVKGKRKGYRDRVKARESGEEEGRGPLVKRVRRDSEDGEGMDVDGEDEAAAQLRGEEAAANGDETEVDGDVAEDDEDDVDEDEDEQDEADGEEDEEVRRDRDVEVDMDDDRPRAALAPNGRVEIGSDEESD